jgi:hypothetical protein
MLQVRRDLPVCTKRWLLVYHCTAIGILCDCVHSLLSSSNISKASIGVSRALGENPTGLPLSGSTANNAACQCFKNTKPSTTTRVNESMTALVCYANCYKHKSANSAACYVAKKDRVVRLPEYYAKQLMIIGYCTLNSSKSMAPLLFLSQFLK